MDDVGLQQAIFASLQTVRSGAPPPPPPRSYYGPSVGASSGTSNVTRTPVAASRQRDIHPTMPRYAPVGGAGGGSAGGAGGRRNMLEREGIAPTTPYRAGVPPRRRGVASSCDDTFEATGSDFVGFTHSSSPNGGWDNSTDIVHDAYPHLLGSRAGPLSRHAPPLTSQRPRPVLPAPTSSSTADFGAPPPSRQRATSSGVGGRGAHAGGGRAAVSDAATLPLSGWHELPGIGGGGRVVRQNPSGSHFGLECGMHQPPLDAQLTAIAHSQLLLVAGDGAAAVKGTTVVLSLNVKPSTRGVVFFVGVDSSGHTEEDGYGTPPPAQSRLGGASHRALTRFSGASILFSAEAPFITSDTFAVEGEGIVRVARQDRPHALKVPARGLEAGLNVTMYLSSGSLAFEVNGERVIRNLPVSSLRSPTDARLILAAAGGRVMVKNVAVENGEAARQRKAAADPKMQAKVAQDRGFVSVVESEMLEQSPNVQWEDVAALGDAKRLLNEAVILPTLVPEFFTGLRTPWKGVLLYGPPGTGKTMLAKAVATCAKTTFLSVSAASIYGKFLGESEKLVRAIFQVARERAPSTIFIDEIDAIMMRRGEGTEHEASRRVKTEILQQLDGIGTGGADEPRVIILAATNRPWDLDDAMRRRLEKRIYVPLPDAAARTELLRLLAKKVRVEPTVDFAQLATALDGYSCADIHVLCRDAAMMPMRRLIADKSPTEIVAMKEAGLLAEPPALSGADFQNSIQKIQPSVAQTDLARFDSWTKEFGAM